MEKNTREEQVGIMAEQELLIKKLQEKLHMRDMTIQSLRKTMQQNSIKKEIRKRALEKVIKQLNHLLEHEWSKRLI